MPDISQQKNEALALRTGVATADDGTKLYWSETGSGPPIVCCNGAGVSTFFWKYFVQHFSEGFRVVTWDYRGHGSSGRVEPTSDLSVARMSRDLLAVMDGVGCPSALLVGHAYGMQVILEAWRSDPSRALGIVSLMGTAGHSLESFSDTIRPARYWRAFDRIAQAVGPAGGRLLGNLRTGRLAQRLLLLGVDRYYANEADLSPYLQHLQAVDLRVFLRMLIGSDEHDGWDLLPQLQVPVLIVAAERDTLAPMHVARRMVQAIPGADFLVLAEATHAALIEQPDTVSRRVDRFLTERRVFEDAPDIVTTRSFFEMAGRRTIVKGPGRLSVPQPVVVASGVPPRARDALDAGTAAPAGDRVYFVYRKGLPEPVADELNGLRLQNHPVVPLALEVMSAALADGSCRRVLFEHDQRYSGQQNLYTTRNALTDSRAFYGREDLLTRLGSAIGAGEAILITGVRKSGKTSLVNMLRQSLHGQPWCVVDLMRFDRLGDDWPAMVFHEAITAFDRWGASLVPGWVVGDSLREGDYFGRLALRRDQQRKLHREAPLVLVLDEIERVLPRECEPELTRRFVHGFGLLRALIQQGGDRPLRLVAVDLRPTLNRVNILPTGDTNPVYSLFQEVALPMFTIDELGAMVLGIGREMGLLRVSASFVADLHGLTGGHPALARHVAGRAFELRHEPDELVSTDFAGAIESLHGTDDIWSFFEQNIYGPMTSDERLVVHSVASRLGPPDRPSAVAALVEQGILRRDGLGLEIAMGGLAHWLRSGGGR